MIGKKRIRGATAWRLEGRKSEIGADTELYCAWVIALSINDAPTTWIGDVQPKTIPRIVKLVMIQYVSEDELSIQADPLRKPHVFLDAEVDVPIRHTVDRSD